VCAALATAIALATDFGALQPQGYLSDFASVVDPASRAEIERYSKRVEQATGAQLAFMTIGTLGGEPVEDVANLIYLKWGIGKKGSNEGVLLLMVVQDRKTRLEVGYGLEPILPDGFVGSLLREMRPALRQQQYGQALLAASHMLGERIAASKGVKIGTQPMRRRYARERSLPWWMIVGGIALLLFLLRAGGGGPGGFLLGMLLGNVMGRPGGSGGGGGFGGFDSGDGFGGFGGGDSGGGGASGDW